MIEVKNLNKRFGDNELFNNYSFKIKKGDFICFSGVSGVGKTTLLNMIGHIEPFDKGEILIDGKKYNTNKDRLEFFQSKVGFLFQNFALIENKTVKENLNIIKKNNRTNYTIKQVLRKVGLENKLNSKVYTLSGGEQQRIALARLYLKKCDLILADEPTGSLDSKNANIVMKILKQLNNDGKTIIIVTHDNKIKEKVGKVIEIV